jgi:putative flavoprotein involved in K+ transport
MREHVRNVVGDEVADSLSEVWGLDEEGEIRGIFRPSGHPNLWYSAGAFYNTRYGSRLIARQIKASIEGIR